MGWHRAGDMARRGAIPSSNPNKKMQRLSYSSGYTRTQHQAYRGHTATTPTVTPRSERRRCTPGLQ